MNAFNSNSGAAWLTMFYQLFEYYVAYVMYAIHISVCAHSPFNSANGIESRGSEYKCARETDGKSNNGEK